MHSMKRSGVNAVFKCENFQKGGAFKIRGAANFLYSIPKADLPRGVVAYSSGNHAQAVAIAAKSVGAPATLVMPEDAPRSKMEATRAQGPRIITYDRFKDDRGAIGAKISAETGAMLVPPYDHPWTMAGQGTAALELLDQAPDLDALVDLHRRRWLDRGLRDRGQAPEAVDPHLRRRAGECRTIRINPSPPASESKFGAPDTIADGLRSPSPGELTFPMIQKHVEQIVLVTRGRDQSRR